MKGRDTSVLNPARVSTLIEWILSAVRYRHNEWISVGSITRDVAEGIEKECADLLEKLLEKGDIESKREQERSAVINREEWDKIFGYIRSKIEDAIDAGKEIKVEMSRGEKEIESDSQWRRVEPNGQMTFIINIPAD